MWYLSKYSFRASSTTSLWALELFFVRAAWVLRVRMIGSDKVKVVRAIISITAHEFI